MSTRCRLHRRGGYRGEYGKAKRAWKWVKAWLTVVWDWGFCWWERRRDAVPPRITTRTIDKMLEGEGERDTKSLIRWMRIGKARGKKEAKGMEKTRICDQEGSFFFKLPAELRNKIYQHLFKEERVYIAFDKGRLGCYKAVMSEDGKVETKKRAALGLMPFIGCCWRVYTETIPLLYSSPTFVVTHPSTFLIFSYLIPAPRFHAIRSLILDFGVYIPGNLKAHLTTLSARIQLREKVEFHALHVSQHRAFYNEALVDLGIRRKAGGEKTVWTCVCAILDQMEALVDLRVSVMEWTHGKVLEPLEGLLSKKREDGGVGMRTLLVETLFGTRNGFMTQMWWEGGFNGEEGDGEGRWRRLKHEDGYPEDLILLGVGVA